MPGTDPGSAREEAERLIAAVLAAASHAARGLGSDGAGAGLGAPGGGGFATGSPECCVCPICRAIAALRDPSPEFAERLATGAGDFAAGLASLLRAFGASAARPGAAPRAHPGDGATTGTTPPARWSSGDDEVWRVATRADVAGQPVATPPMGRKAMARKAVKRPAPPALDDPIPTAGGHPVSGFSPAVPRKGAPRKAAPKKAAAPAPGADSGAAHPSEDD